jgi:hypothetical protein
VAETESNVPTFSVIPSTDQLRAAPIKAGS